MVAPEEVLRFWYSDRARPLWFEKNNDFDDEIRSRFGATVDAALAGAFEEWCEMPADTLALVIVLDQFPRNMFRGSGRALAGDDRALAIADAAIKKGIDRSFNYDERRFLYLPFEHSEDLEVQKRCITLFEAALCECTPEERDGARLQLEYAHRHRVIIERFGRFPHRNAALGRRTTEEEAAFLAGPNSSF